MSKLSNEALVKRSKFIEAIIDGEYMRKSYTDWDRYKKFPRGTVCSRLRRNWSEMQAIGVEPPPKRKERNTPLTKAQKEQIRKETVDKFLYNR